MERRRVCMCAYVCVLNQSEATMTTVMRLHLKTFRKFPVHIVVFNHHDSRDVFVCSAIGQSVCSTKPPRGCFWSVVLSFTEHACRIECTSELSKNVSHDELASAFSKSSVSSFSSRDWHFPVCPLVLLSVVENAQIRSLHSGGVFVVHFNIFCQTHTKCEYYAA